MQIELYIAFVAASALLIVTPGPMVAYIVATSATKGLRPALLAVAGSMLASAIHLTIVAFGLAALMNAASSAFIWLKWAGAAYLLVLGIHYWRSQPAPFEASPSLPARSYRRVFLEGLLVNLTNPKGIVFHGAFLPLFISPSAPAGPQLFLLAITFIAIGGALDTLWAVLAARAKPVLARAGRWRGRLTGGVMISAAAGLALTRT